MDTIPQGLRLVPFTNPAKAFILVRSRRHQLSNMLANIEAQVRAYNLSLRFLSMSERAAYNLTVPHLSQTLAGTLTIVHHDSPGWLATISPKLPKPGATARELGRGPIPRPINPSSQAELRQYAIRKGVPILEAWSRFPPTSTAEREELLRLQTKSKKPALDPMEAALRAAARREKRQLDDGFRKEFATKLEGLASILGDLL